MNTTLWVLLTLGCAAAAATPLPVEISLTVSSPVEVEAEVTVRCGDWEPSVDQLPLVVGVNSVALETPRGSACELEVRGPSVWAEPVIFTPQAEGPSVGLLLQPTVAVTGTVSVPTGHELPGIVTAGFQWAPGAGEVQRSVPTTHVVQCAVTGDSRFRCAIPARPVDLRIRAAGFSSAYFWNLTLEPDKPRDLGTVALVPGASILAWVVVELPGIGGSVQECLQKRGPRAPQ